MISISNVKSASSTVHYFEKDNYYAKDDIEHTDRSEWFGSGATQLGLNGNVLKEQFNKILSGILPNGMTLGRKQKGERIHAPGIDVTFSVPKSVSIQAEVLGDKRLYDAQRRAVHKTLAHIEKNMVGTRVNSDGKTRHEKVDNITAALFVHNVSRNLDPQLHTHCILANAVEGRDGKWRSAFFGDIFENKLFLGQIYRNELAKAVRDLGYELRITNENSGFEIASISDELIEKFSSRSKDIEDAAAQLENVDAKKKAELALKTRKAKQEYDRNAVHEKWQETLKDHIEGEQAKNINDTKPDHNLPTADTVEPSDNKHETTSENPVKIDDRTQHHDLHNAPSQHKEMSRGNSESIFPHAENVGQEHIKSTQNDIKPHDDVQAQDGNQSMSSNDNSAEITDSSQSRDSMSPELSSKDNSGIISPKEERRDPVCHSTKREELPKYSSTSNVSSKQNKYSDIRNTVSKLSKSFTNKWNQFCKRFDTSQVFKFQHITDIANKNDANQKALDYAINHLSERSSVWSEKDMMRKALGSGIGHITYDTINQKVNQYKNEGKLLEGSGSKASDLLTSKEVLDKERELITYVNNSFASHNGIRTRNDVNAYIKNHSLTNGQKDAIRLILTSKDRIVGIQGYAGVGKTYMLKHARILGEDAGYKFIGIAPTAAAAKTMENDSGIKSSTAHKFLYQFNGLINDKATKSGIEAMRSKMRNTVVVMDESSLSSTTQLTTLLKIADTLKFKVVLVGDTKQLGSVEAGKPFYQAQNAGMATAVIKETVRYKDKELEIAVHKIIDRRISEAFKRLKNSIHEYKDATNHDLLLARPAIQHWKALSEEQRNNTLVIVPSHKLRTQMNNEVREFLKQEKKLYGQEHTVRTYVREDFTKAEKLHPLNYTKDMIVSFYSADRKLGISAKESYNVKSATHSHVVLQAPDGKEIKWQPSKAKCSKDGAFDVFKSDERQIMAGDRMCWTKNSYQDVTLINSNSFKILNISDNTLYYQNDAGEEHSIPLHDPRLKHIEHGYVSTIHASQGKTFDNTIAVMSSHHPHLTNQRLFYVAASRARHGLTFITDSKKLLKGVLKNKTGDRTSAFEHRGISKRTPEKDVYNHNDPMYSTKNRDAVHNSRASTTKSRTNLESPKHLHTDDRSNENSTSTNAVAYNTQSIPIEHKEHDSIGAPKAIDANAPLNTQNSEYLPEQTKLEVGIDKQPENLESTGSETQEIAATDNTHSIDSPKGAHDALEEKALDEPKDKSKKIDPPPTKFNKHYKDNYTKEDIYHMLYPQLPSILPEFGFVRRGSHMISTTTQKVNGSHGSKGKVYVYANNPGTLIDYTAEKITLWDYLRQYHGISDKEMMKYLRSLAGLTNSSINPKSPLPTTQIQEEKVPVIKRNYKLLNAIFNFTTDELFSQKNQAIQYLRKDRGYSDSEIKMMGFGYLKSKNALAQYLKAHGFSNENIKEAYKLLHNIGKTHKLIIPYRDIDGKIAGFVARITSHHEKMSKYLYTKDLGKSQLVSAPSGITGDKHVIIVEGVVDSLRLNAHGVKNVISLGGSSLNQSQLNSLINKGVKSITLALDNDLAGKDATNRISKMIKDSKAPIELKALTLPKNIKDPDQMISQSGGSSFNKLVNEAKTISVPSPIKSKDHILEV